MKFYVVLSKSGRAAAHSLTLSAAYAIAISQKVRIEKGSGLITTIKSNRNHLPVLANVSSYSWIHTNASKIHKIQSLLCILLL